MEELDVRGTGLSAAVLADIVGQRADVESVTLVAADDALAEFRELSGFGEAVDQLSANPLPHTLVVRPAASNTEVTMGMLLPPKAEYVNLHPNCFHLWEVDDLREA